MSIVNRYRNSKVAFLVPSTTLYSNASFRNKFNRSCEQSANPHRKLSTSRRSITKSNLSDQAISTAPSFRLSPSDFAFLWEECHRCFYLKAHKKLFRPRAPFPTVFGTIDTGMKRHFRGLRTDEIMPTMRPGTFLCEEKDAWVESTPITPPGHNANVYIRGMVDCLVRFDDHTFGIVDFKTSSNTRTSSTYSRQLHAYTLALENPSINSELEQGTVSDMSLIVYSPKDFHTPTQETGGFSAVLTGDLTHLPVPRDDQTFLTFLTEVTDLLTRPEAPLPPPPHRKWGSGSGGSFSSCPYCQYLHDAHSHGFIPSHVSSG